MVWQQYYKLYLLITLLQQRFALMVREKKEAPEQKVEEDETDTIESKEIVDKTNEDQAEK